MWRIKKINVFLIVLIGVFGTMSTLPEECFTTLVQSQSCLWYLQCLYEKFECGSKGYPDSYGYKYCTKFSNLNTFPAAREWIYKTLVCLKQKLTFTLSDSVSLTCEYLKRTAFDTHPTCYVYSGFCKLWKQLGPSDSVIFLRQLYKVFEAKDFESVLALKQIKDVLADCVI